MSDAGLAAPAPAAPARPDRGAVFGLAILAALALAPFAAEAAGEGWVASIVLRAMTLAIAAISLDLLIGRGGMVSLGHAAFFAIGAYAVGVSLEEGLVEMALILPLALAAAAVFALASGAVSLRTSGVSFIMITLAFGQMVFFALSSLAAYGGDDGLTLWFAPELLGTRALEADGAVYAAALATLAAVWAGAHSVAGSRFGRVLRAAKQNPDRVETMGYSVFRVRLAAYVIAGCVAALAGVLWATHSAFVSPALGAWQRSGDLIAMVVLGGMGSRNGALIGALVFVGLEEALSSVTHDWRLIFGPLIVLVALRARGGLAGLLDAAGPRR